MFQGATDPFVREDLQERVAGVLGFPGPKFILLDFEPIPVQLFLARAAFVAKSDDLAP